MPGEVTSLDRKQPAKVVLIGLDVESFGESSGFEVQRCEHVRHVPRICEEPGVGVLLVKLERLSDSESATLCRLMKQFKTVLVLAIVDSMEDEACEKLLRMGCVGSLRSRETPATIRRAVEAVIAGQLWFPRGTLSRVLRGFLNAHDPQRLTSRELEILDLVGADPNTQQIADKLSISRETVRWHMKSLHAKLGTRTRRGLGDHVRLMNRLGKALPVQRESARNPRSRAS